MMEQLIEGFATAIPIIATSVILLYKFKNELCRQISDLRVEVETHIKISENQMSEFEKMKERITNVILKNNLKF